MADRTELQELLESILGSNAVYFQPPPTIQLVYPCIIYKRSNINTKFANNYPYKLAKEYTITVIDKDPDSIIPDKIAALQTCVFDRYYTADNLNHNVFTIYF
mgnify:CR=1 FL=1